MTLQYLNMIKLFQCGIECTGILDGNAKSEFNQFIFTFAPKRIDNCGDESRSQKGSNPTYEEIMKSMFSIIEKSSSLNDNQKNKLRKGFNF